MAPVVRQGQGADGQRPFDVFGDDIAEATGVLLLRRMVRAEEAYAALNLQDLERAERCVAELESGLPPAQPNPAAMTFFLRSGVALMRGDLPTALSRAEAALQYANECGMPIGLAVCELQIAQVLAGLSEFRRAQGHLDQAIDIAHRIGSPLLEHAALLLRADLLLRGGERQASAQTLSRGLAIGREQGFTFIYPWSRPEVLSRLASFALDAHIEVDHVLRLIKRHALPCPSESRSEHWPWPIRVRTLGRFGIFRDSEAIESAGKVQRKPLDLLKALIALGGSHVDVDALAGLLWPDPEVDAKNLFDNTLHRLRRLLGDADAILVRDGKLTLNAAVVWVDAREFESLVERGDDRGHDDGPDAAPARESSEAFRLYRGSFLELENDRPWMLPMRERLRSKFMRHIGGIGERCESWRTWDQAVELYRRGIEVDPLAESLYRRLMRCHVRLGDSAEALNVYRRCRDMLSIVLGARPAPATEEIRQQILESLA